jgi:hypothetical protein
MRAVFERGVGKDYQTLYRQGDRYFLAVYDTGPLLHGEPRSVRAISEQKAKALVWEWVSNSRSGYDEMEEWPPSPVPKVIDGGRLR